MAFTSMAEDTDAVSNCANSTKAAQRQYRRPLESTLAQTTGTVDTTVSVFCNQTQYNPDTLAMWSRFLGS